MGVDKRIKELLNASLEHNAPMTPDAIKFIMGQFRALVNDEDDTEYRDRMIKLNNAMAYWQNNYFNMFAQHQAILKELNQLRGMAVAEANKVVKKN